MQILIYKHVPITSYEIQFLRWDRILIFLNQFKLNV